MRGPMLTLKQRVQHSRRGRRELFDSLLADNGACENANRAFDEQNASVWGDMTVQSYILGNVLACSTQPGTEYDELSWPRLRRRVKECSGSDDNEIC